MIVSFPVSADDHSDRALRCLRLFSVEPFFYQLNYHPIIRTNVDFILSESAVNIAAVELATRAAISLSPLELLYIRRHRGRP